MTFFNRISLSIFFYAQLSVCLASVCLAQNTTLSGVVVSNEDGLPLAGARVFIEALNLETLSGSDGRFALRVTGGSSDAGRCVVSVFKAGFALLKREVDCRIDRIENFRLKPLAYESETITVEADKTKPFGIKKLGSVEGAAIYEGKKSESIQIEGIAANTAANTARQLYAKVAGLNIAENDGAGVQLGIGARGLNPNRTANFNVRQNGYDISADALGYPESYYTPPSEALEKIEVVRGAASLQYGTQFGGMLNFVFKSAPADKAFEFTSRQTGGSFGFFNSFNSIGGTLPGIGGNTGSLAYTGFYQFKRGDGWRPNSGFDLHTAFASATLTASENLTLRGEWTWMTYLAQQPGGLTDAEFSRDPQLSKRPRNWFNVDWQLGAVIADYKFNERTVLNSRFFALFAGRQSLGNLQSIERPDDFSAAAGGLTRNRTLISDAYRNFGNETRLLHRYFLFGNLSTALAGVRYYNGFTDRKQGDGNDGAAPDFFYLHPDNLENSAYRFPSRNTAVFIENIFVLTPRLSLTPGVRYEFIRTDGNGYYRLRSFDLAGNLIADLRTEENLSRVRSFALFGLGVSYTLTSLSGQASGALGSNLELYGNLSQNYRAATFNDFRVVNPNFIVDPDLRDERGYNLDAGIRGTVGNWIYFDANLFYLRYSDRIGTDFRGGDVSSGFIDYRYRTNIADAQIYGLEAFGEVDVSALLSQRPTPVSVSIFTNLSVMNSRYLTGGLRFEGKQVELVSPLLLKTGATVRFPNTQLSVQYSYTAEQFSDASNARTPTANAVAGIVPVYGIVDLIGSVRFGVFKIEGSVNNLLDARYFTRRADGYPGPGILPSDARNFYLTLGVQL